MPITHNSKLIQKYVPEKHIVGASVEVDNSGYLLLRDNFISVFPAIMEYKEQTPFASEEVIAKQRWCAYIVFEGIETLFISKSSSFDSLKSEIEDSSKDLWHSIPAWYTTVLQEKEDKICGNIWAVFLEKDIILYLKLQQEYGYMQGESKTDKSLLFPKQKTNNQNFLETLSLILKDKVMKGEITQTDSKNIIFQYAKLKN